MIYLSHPVMLCPYLVNLPGFLAHVMSPSKTKPLQRRHIEALVAVGDVLSVHRAARELGMQQPTVSRLLAEAESLLGARLFERSSHGSKATAQGESVIAQARFVLRSLDRLNNAVAEVQQKIQLGCIPRAMYTLMPRLLDRMYPAAAQPVANRDAAFRLGVTEGGSAKLMESLSRGILDFAILRSAGGRHDGDVEVERLYNDRIVVICATGNKMLAHEPVALSRLSAQGWVLPESQTTSRVAFDLFWAERNLPPIQPIIEVRSFEANLALVAGTRFISIAPESIVRRYAGMGIRTLQVRPALPASPVMLAYHRELHNSVALGKVRKLIHESAPAGR